MVPSTPAILQGETTGGETTGESTSLVEGAAKAAQEIPEKAGQELSGVRDFFNGIATYFTTTQFIGSVVASVVVVVLAVVFYRVAIRLIPRVLRWRRRSEEALDATSLARIKRQDTVITLVRTTLRYAIFAVVALFIVGIFLRNVLPTIGGAALLAAIIGFGAQNLLRDIIAGFFILFEEQYSVGDFITVEPSQASGLVEEFGLRTTTIRALSGEIIYVPNGSLIAVTNYVTGQQRFTIEVQLKDEEAAKRVLEEVQEEHSLYLSPPRLARRDETPGGGPRLRLLAVVLPSTAWLVEENLVERIKAAAGEDGLAAEPLVYKVDERNLQRIREFIPEE